MKQDTTELRLTFINVGYGEAILIDAPDAGPAGRTLLCAHRRRQRCGQRVRRPHERPHPAQRSISPRFAARPRGQHAYPRGSSLRSAAACAAIIRPLCSRQTLPCPWLLPLASPLGDASARNLSERNFLAALDDYRKLCALVEQHGGCIEQSLAGDTLTLAPGLTAEVLAPSGTRAAALTASMQELYRTPQGVPEFREKLDALDASMNNFSLILRLAFGKTRILLPGDTNRAGYGGIPPEKLAARPLQGRPSRSARRRGRGACKCSPTAVFRLLCIERPPLQQCSPRHHAPAEGQRRRTLLFRLSPRGRSVHSAPPGTRIHHLCGRRGKRPLSSLSVRRCTREGARHG